MEVDMTKTTLVIFSVLLLAFAGTALYGQTQFKPLDVSGTWTGDTELPNSDAKDHVTLILKKAGDSFSGTITMLGAKDAAVENLSFEDEDTFSFQFTATSGGNKNVVKVKLDVINDKLLGNSLMGAWTMDSGDYGRMELNPKK
jgi:hypothetical protein